MFYIWIATQSTSYVCLTHDYMAWSCVIRETIKRCFRLDHPSRRERQTCPQYGTEFSAACLNIVFGTHIEVLDGGIDILILKEWMPPPSPPSFHGHRSRDCDWATSTSGSQILTSALLKDKRVSPVLLDAAEFSAACLHIVFGTHNPYGGFGWGYWHIDIEGMDVPPPRPPFHFQSHRKPGLGHLGQILGCRPLSIVQYLPYETFIHCVSIHITLNPIKSKDIVFVCFWSFRSF